MSFEFANITKKLQKAAMIKCKQKNIFIIATNT